MVDNAPTIQLTAQQVQDLFSKIETLTKQLDAAKNDLEVEKAKATAKPAASQPLSDTDRQQVAMATLSRIRQNKEYQNLANQNRSEELVEMAINYVLKDYQVNPPSFKR